MPADPRAAAAGLYEAARGAAAALFRPDPTASEALSRLSERLEAAITSTGTYAERWARVARGSDEVAEWARPVLLLHLLFPRDTALPRKLALLDEPGPETALREALAVGVAPSGAAFKLRRLSQLAFLTRAAQAAHATNLPWADDAAACRAWLHGVDLRGGQSQREALLHLLHPDAFEPIASVAVKRRLRDALAPGADRTVDDDEALATFRRERRVPSDRPLLELHPEASRAT